MSIDTSPEAVRARAHALVVQSGEEVSENDELDLSSAMTGHYHIKGRQKERSRICWVLRKMADEISRCLDPGGSADSLRTVAAFIDNREHWKGRWDVGDNEKVPMRLPR